MTTFANVQKPVWQVGSWHKNQKAQAHHFRLLKTFIILLELVDLEICDFYNYLEFGNNKVLGIVIYFKNVTSVSFRPKSCA